jgi:hypothetical protein
MDGPRVGALGQSLLAQLGKRPTTGRGRLGKMLRLELVKNLAQQRPAEVEMLVQLLKRLIGAQGQRPQDAQQERIQGDRPVQADQGFDAVKKEMTEPQGSRLKRRQLFPPAGQDPATWIDQGWDTCHVPLLCRR